MTYLHIDKVYGNYPNFSTKPLHAVLNNGNRVYIKVFQNIQGNRALANEYICYKLCKILDLPIPEAGIAFLDEKTENLCNETVYNEENYGFCFFSKRIDKATVVNQAIVPKIVNKEIIYRIILFDHLVYNKDRNKGNLLVTSGKKPTLYLIDHTHVFKNECIWDNNCFLQGMNNQDYLDKDINEANKWIYNCFWDHLAKDENVLLRNSQNFKSKINGAVFDEILNELPTSWEVSEKDAASLKEYLLYRLEHLDQMCKIIVGR